MEKIKRLVQLQMYLSILEKIWGKVYLPENVY